jgi:hypothetical protein
VSYTVDDSDADEDWVAPDPTELVEYEDSLPPLYDLEDAVDCYKAQWERLGHGYGAVDLDDAPSWVATVREPCRRCNERDDLDLVGTCEDCRDADRRCRWCGLDPIVYAKDKTCRTCYQRLRRHDVTPNLRLRLAMLDSASSRLDQRKRPSQG